MIFAFGMEKAATVPDRCFRHGRIGGKDGQNIGLAGPHISQAEPEPPGRSYGFPLSL
jgi:hypothetical protein